MGGYHLKGHSDLTPLSPPMSALDLHPPAPPHHPREVPVPQSLSNECEKALRLENKTFTLSSYVQMAEPPQAVAFFLDFSSSPFPGVLSLFADSLAV